MNHVPEVHIDGAIKLYHGDCLSLWQDLKGADHVICDPPYESHMHKTKKGARGIRTDGHRPLQAVNFSSIEDIRDRASSLMFDLSRGWIIAFCTPEGIAPWRDALEAAGARYKRACIWVKPDAAPQFNGQGPAMGAECFVTAWAGRGTSSWQAGGRSNVFTHMIRSSDRDGRHETEKPLSLMLEIVGCFTEPGDTVLDPFMGSGTTGVACIRLGRKFIGVERDRRYFEIAVTRIRAAVDQPDLFIKNARKAKQVGLPMPLPRQSKKELNNDGVGRGAAAPKS